MTRRQILATLSVLLLFGGSWYMKAVMIPNLENHSEIKPIDTVQAALDTTAVYNPKEDTLTDIPYAR